MYVVPYASQYLHANISVHTKIRSLNYYGKPFGFHVKNDQTIKW